MGDIQKNIRFDYKMFRSNAKNAVRINKEEEHHLRDAFDRDRDRIMYSKAFRRLSGKTQIFLASKDDHARNRLTHTLEVSQIARTIAKTLGLNETLVEAIALGHDIGHTPFGHVGERTLDKIMSGCYEIEGFTDVQRENGYTGFKHNWQSVKVASQESDNLNLTTVTLWGILNHSKLEYKKCNYLQDGNKCGFRCQLNKICNHDSKNQLSYYQLGMTEKDGHLLKLTTLIDIDKDWTFEGYIVAIADEIAQRHHDIEDAIEYKLISETELKEKLEIIVKECLDENGEYYEQDRVKENDYWINTYEEHKESFEKLRYTNEKEKFLANLSKFIVNLLTTDVIFNTAYLLNGIMKKFNITNEDEFENIKDIISDYVKQNKNLYSPVMQKCDKKLEDLLRNRILNSYQAQKMDGMGQYIIREMFKAYALNPQQLPDTTIQQLFNNYYRIKFDCRYKKVLVDDGYIAKGKYNVGEMRNRLEFLHFSKPEKEYKIALLRTICEYIAGMTDKYAMEKHRELYNIEYK